MQRKASKCFSFGSVFMLVVLSFFLLVFFADSALAKAITIADAAGRTASN